MTVDMEEAADQQWLESRSLLVLYASETGKSQEVAEEIGDVVERMRFPTLVAPMNDVSLVGRWVLPIISGCYLTKDNILARPASLFFSNICGLNYWPRRSACKCHHLLEEPTQKEVACTLFEPGALCFVWSRRQLLRKVQLGCQEVSTAHSAAWGKRVCCFWRGRRETR